MANIAAITLALLASASSLAWAQGAPAGMGGAPAPATAMPGSAAPAGFTIDQKGVKRAGSSAPSPGNAGGPGTSTAAGTGKAPVGTGANPGTDASGNKSFFESRSNTNPRAASAGPANARTTPTASATGTVAPDDSAKKSYFESRSNTARTDGAAAKSIPEAAPGAGSVFKN